MRGDPGLLEILKCRSPSELALTTISLAEIYYGIAKSPVKKVSRRHKIDMICEELEIYPFDEAAAEQYGAIRATLEKRGTTISERDLQIASIGIANKLFVVTHNVREFQRIEGLKIEDWMEARL